MSKSKRTPITERKARPTFTAGQVLKLLRARFTEDYFCTSEIGLGRGGQRADFLALRPSHARPDVVICEVKVSRADFMGDNKWTGYLPFCTRFFFVTAPGVATKDEIAKDAGWMELTTNGARLVTRKAAPALRGELEPKHEAQVLRSIIHRHFYGTHRDPDVSREERIEAWSRFVETRDKAHVTGHLARRAVREHILKADKAVVDARRTLEAFQQTEHLLKGMGISPDRMERAHRNGVLANELRNAFAREFGGEATQQVAEIERASRHFTDTMMQYGKEMTRAAANLRSALEKASSEPAAPDPGELSL